MKCRPHVAAPLLLLICVLSLASPTFADSGAQRPSGLTVTAVGDIMPSSSFPSRTYLSSIPDETLSRTLGPILENADIRFGNLEGTMAGDATCLKACRDSKTCYAFNIPFGYADTLKRAGFNLFSLANNHISDFGTPGRERTVRHLGESGIACAGTLEKPWDILYANGLYVGFAAFAPHKGVADLLDRDAAVRRVRTLSTFCDIVIVSMHGGAEGSDAGHVPRQDEIYLGENRGDLYAFSHAVVDAGADLVIGHGPHVVRGMELYKGRLIAYSLGNFFTWARFNLEGPKGLAPALTVNLGQDGRFLNGSIRSLRQPYRSLPVADPSHTAAKETARLSREDFPESPLRISDEGELSVR
ncbi:CapA family protein [Desulfoluna spongiiphila]|uniref:Capsule synthesis protein PGA_cap n=1 Tax=Desulfoluna spongiiphila TaxID=419481 RepID=A0A1G5HSI6_9BACT|nr:CapA family protein [Desulfoluna spongiiphila]SCY66756.1 capsule synthesis protein PGA_cap [Desulfoluna spongiiphila]